MTNRVRPYWKVPAAVVGLVLAGCAGTSTTAGQQPALTGSGDAMVIEVSVGGGLAPAPVRVSDSLPRVWISADGRYLRQTSEPSSSPALAALEERQISEAALTGLLDDARAAGLFADKPEYGTPRIMDAMVTRIVIVTEGVRREVRISALGYPNPGLDDAAVAARARLSQFLDVLQNPERLDGAGRPASYRPTELAVFVLGPADASAPDTPASWPLGDLGTAGTPTDWPVGSARCLVVTGGELDSVVTAAAGVGRFAPWRSGDGLWDIALRPLLPDEHRCADVLG